MIIVINEDQKVISTADGVAEIGVEVDNVTSFKVADKPERVPGKVMCFNPETRAFYFKDLPPVNLEALKARQAKLVERKAAERKKAEALKWLADNDWKVNKYIIGEWSAGDTRWLDYLSGRSKARASIDEAEAILKSII